MIEVNVGRELPSGTGWFSWGHPRVRVVCYPNNKVDICWGRMWVRHVGPWWKFWNWERYCQIMDIQ